MKSSVSPSRDQLAPAGTQPSRFCRRAGVGGQALDRLQRPAVAALARDGVAGQQGARVAHETGEVDADGADLAAGVAGQAVPERGLQRRPRVLERQLSEPAGRVEAPPMFTGQTDVHLPQS